MTPFENSVYDGYNHLINADGSKNRSSSLASSLQAHDTLANLRKKTPFRSPFIAVIHCNHNNN